ncbi:hypothetical protein [Sphingomonas fennica]|uniref:Sulfotransferase family protein n=1 Tax=Edaphosphingomonas fennica TaxID=114404 RepID=A0A2T4HJQ0_9SPHN|nr:hypothetical protein [Sphingomonas fennica]PTD16032.1 hypothetical protein CV103_20915 [Sphingomonas fennica]
MAGAAQAASPACGVDAQCAISLRVTDKQISALDVVRDAEWLPHRYDPQYDAVHFRHTPRDEHERATFLTDDYLAQEAPKLVLRRDEAAGAAPAEAPIHYIFHSAFCCSTLLARVFERPGYAMGLKEPVLLNDLVGWRRRGGEPKRIAMALDHGLRLLGRPFSPGEAIVIKPSNIVNILATAMLGMRPNSRALLLHAPLRTFLTSVAKKGMDGRLWVRRLLLGHIMDGLRPFGFTENDYLGQTDLQVAAVGWLTQHALFADLIGRFGPERVRSLDSETLMASPAEALRALSAFYGLTLEEGTIHEIVGQGAFTRHSKTGSDYSIEARVAEYRDATAAHADEIDKVAQWAEAIARSAGHSLRLDAPLLG